MLKIFLLQNKIYWSEVVNLKPFVLPLNWQKFKCLQFQKQMKRNISQYTAQLILLFCRNGWITSCQLIFGLRKTPNFQPDTWKINGNGRSKFFSDAQFLQKALYAQFWSTKKSTKSELKSKFHILCFQINWRGQSPIWWTWDAYRLHFDNFDPIFFANYQLVPAEFPTDDHIPQNMPTN